ncbi:pyruvate oxidase [Fructilactobacillus fructivorans]|uniref:Pyruvate oxidase n=1 Tax=Fructilactobacillus fructivorans TaxID=1614 RepID=A0AAE6P2H4_9LACO|nr:pyruvate oxidase [Fructilactobacillus fructivorans]KRK57445.1 pyruvate oxidase [Fructilactobacillus fructivorans]KRN41101.1 pyruvate oxidase [Fructilactobacillus fructivorans]KRN42915.1 pyruvate oxidase [Fructilactobacillus fructivorans]QFX93123.1 pyruvate oxidase [Fructilactobacillus fructivorans]RDV64739.1 pyruvate oxidase [Fructilactobacillus fructivorans]
MSKMTASRALVKVLESWDVDHLYGITAGSLNNLLNALDEEKDNIKYVQVRHEEVGAMAASADHKYTGKIGVAFGSAGPGATHMFNGLYDAKEDNTPMLALVGQVPQPMMNTRFFQEMDELPMFADVSVYNRQASTAKQIPKIIDEAIRTAYQKKGPAVVILPNDLLGTEIDYEPIKTANVSSSIKTVHPKQADVDEAVKMIKEAKHPVLWYGRGAKGARDEIVKVSDQFSMPVLSTAPATGIMPNDNLSYMGARGRLGSKPGFEVSQAADLIIMLGNDFPFARFMPQDKQIIQVNNNLADLGRQYQANLTIHGDAKEFLEMLIDSGVKLSKSDFLKAARLDRENWLKWLDSIATDYDEGLRAETVLKAVADHSKSDAVYGLDVGNNTMHSIRQLPLNQEQKFAMSPWFGTMGFGLPASISAKLSYPDRQVWSISGDGGFAMVMQDLLTQAKYNLPVINVVLSNDRFGYIEHEDAQSDISDYGTKLYEADFAQVADGLGGHGFKVSGQDELDAAMEEVDRMQAEGNTKPIVIDAKIKAFDPIDTSFVPLDPEQFDQKTIDDYKKRYNVYGQPALSEIMKSLK